MKSNTKIYVTKKGYQQYLDALDKAQQALNEHAKTRSEYGINTGDNYRTGAFDERRSALSYSVKEIEDTISRLVVIEDVNAEENTVNMEDIVSIQIENEDVHKIQIVGGMPDMSREDGIIGITINSPMGAAIYKKKIGETVSYKVGKNELTVSILSKEKAEEEGLEP